MSANRELRADIAAIDQESHGGPVIPRQDVNHGWHILPMARAPIKAIREKIGAYLAAIEAEGLESFSIQDVMRSAAVRRIVKDLRIEFGTRIPTKEDVGLVFLTYPSGSMTEVNPIHVLCAVQAEMKKADNRRKLRNASGRSERHLFIVIDLDHYAPWKALNDCDPPENGPELADEMTHLWVATLTRNPNEWIVWYAVRGGPWQRTWLRGLIDGE